MLFNEPKLLKFLRLSTPLPHRYRFSALQRAEIAEIPPPPPPLAARTFGFSALQRAEIAEMLLMLMLMLVLLRFSALQRAEIAEIALVDGSQDAPALFQCSSTSRNC